MNFYASRVYLDTVASVYFRNKATHVRDFEVDGQFFRFLVVGRRRVITSFRFLDYSAPLAASEVESPTHRNLFIDKCVHDTLTVEEWKAGNLATLAAPAPYVDFSTFRSHEAYRAFIAKRGTERFKKNKRLRERLADDYGELSFAVDDEDPNVIDWSLTRKSQQLRDTGLPDIFGKPANWEFFRELKRRGILRCSTLRANGRLLSAWLGFVHDLTWSGWIFTYDHDPALRKYSLGWQLMDSVLEHCYESGLKEFDFSVGPADYKFAYSTHVRVLQPFGTKPLRDRVADSVRGEAKRVLVRFPKLLHVAQGIARSARARH